MERTRLKMTVVIISLWGLLTAMGVYGYIEGKLSGTAVSISLIAFVAGCIVAANNIRRIRKEIAERVRKEQNRQ